MEQKEIGSIYNRAMHYGTMLGALWAVMYLLVFSGTASPLSMMTSIMIYTCSPFIACRIATHYRKKERNNTMSYSQAWIFLVIMYVCATLLGTITNYIYLNHFDQGHFISQVTTMLAEIQESPESTPELIEVSKSYTELLSRINTRSLVWHIMDSDFMNSIILPTIIAFFVKKENKY